MDARARNELTAGTLIAGRYRLLGLIGSGGMGDVYAAEDTRLGGMLRAIKTHRSDEAGHIQLADEAAMLMRLSHPRLPAIIDYIPDGHHGVEMLVMSYIDGIHLKEFVQRRHGRPIPAEAIIDVGLQLARTLDYLHAQHPPVIHRDLKPTNVMVQKDGTVKLIDFGIARCYKPGTERDTLLLGTPGFAAPEQVHGKQSDARTDVYGLGALLYFLLSGGMAPAGEGGGIPNGPLRWKGSHKELEGVIARMLAERSADRYPDMKAACSALLELVREPRSVEAMDRVGGLAWSEQEHHASLHLSIPQQPVACKRIVVASIASGSGATSAAVTLASLIARRNWRCAAFEHPSAGPEWHSLLQAEAAGSSESLAPIAPGYARFEKLGVLWHARHPNGVVANDSAERGKGFRMMEGNADADYSVIDMSSAWTEPDARHLLLEADFLLFVGDPHAAKWTGANLGAAERTRHERQAVGRLTYWIANKDFPFRERTQWMSLFPVRPLALLPYIPPEQWLELLWRGRWLTEDRRLLSALEKAYEPLMARLISPVAHRSRML